MSKQNKFAGTFGKVGDTASGGTKVNGNVYRSAPKATSAPKASSSVSDNVIKMKTGPGDSMGTQTISSHNSINAFTRGIKSRGPYGGPSFSSINNTKADYQKSNTSAISDCPSPSGSSSAKVGGRSSRRSGNKNGSGYMAS